MKIVQLLPELNEGGVERGTMELNRELVKLGHESIVISAGGKLVEQIEKDGGRHFLFDVCSKNPLTAPWRMVKLRHLLKELNPDILHARSRVPAWLTYLANRKLGFPFVTTVHGFNSISPYSAIMGKGDKVICVSGAIEEYIQKHYRVDKKKTIVIPRGVDLVKFNPEKLDQTFIDMFNKKYQLSNKMIITTVGRITQLKDFETFIRAVAIIKSSVPSVVGLIVGGTREDKKNYLKQLKVLAKELNIENDIIFTGSQSQIAEIYALSNVVVSSSKKPESFGRSVAEAIAMNRPVVATNHGGVLDIIEEKKNGYFYAIGSSKELAGKIKEAQELDFNGYEYIFKNYSLNKMVKKTVNIYKGLL